MKTLRQLILTETWKETEADPRFEKIVRMLAQLAYETHLSIDVDMNVVCDDIKARAVNMLRNLRDAEEERHGSRDPDEDDDRERGNF